MDEKREVTACWQIALVRIAIKNGCPPAAQKLPAVDVLVARMELLEMLCPPCLVASSPA
jgi:hypothetical protein